MEIGSVRQVSIVEEMRDAYLDYAMSVITARALPDVRDGLKPVQRRILYAMDDMGLRHDKPHKKSARIVGEVLGKYHPHNDVAVYDAMVRLAQDFSLRYPLVDGHGNFGSVDGDSAAAMRYTEARLAAIAEEMLLDIDKDTVDFVDNFDATLKEPRVLPARLPNLLINGAAGIAVGMATNIPPHNLVEICDAIAFLIDRHDELDDITVEDLMHYVKGPDFPSGGAILGREGIISAYATGKGRVVVRAKVHTEDLRGGRTAIVVTELPYQVNKAGLVEKIAELVRGGRIETISDLRDESDRSGMRVVIELKRGADTQATLNQLLKYTSMQTTFGVNMLALVEGEPRVLSLKRTLQLFIEHRQTVIRRRSQFELARAKNRAHILEGLKIALDNLDEVIDLIRRSRDADVAKTNLMRRFKLTEIQAQAILDLPLRRLAALERRKIEEELAEVRKQIIHLEDLLAHPRKILLLVKQEMFDLRGKYGDARRTRISEEESAELAAEDLIPSEDVVVTISQRGYVKRVGVRSYNVRARSASGGATREEDAPLFSFAANSMHSVLYFTDRGRVFEGKVHQIADESRQARGVPLSNLIGLGSGENVVGVVSVPDYERPEYLVLVTALGKIKRLQLSELSGARASGMGVISLDEGDALRWVARTDGGQELILVTAQGKAIRFSEDEVRPMGRAAGGVNAIRLTEGDQVAAADLVRPGAELVVATREGYAKRTPLDEYASQGRGGSGLLTVDASKLKQIGPIVAVCALPTGQEISLLSAQGTVWRTTVKRIPGAGRAARGHAIVDLKRGDHMTAIAWLNDSGIAGTAPAKDEPEPKRPTGKATGAKGDRKAVPKARPAHKAPGAKAPAKATTGKAKAKPKAGASKPAAKAPAKTGAAHPAKVEPAGKRRASAASAGTTKSGRGSAGKATGRVSGDKPVAKKSEPAAGRAAKVPGKKKPGAAGQGAGEVADGKNPGAASQGAGAKPSSKKPETPGQGAGGKLNGKKPAPANRSTGKPASKKPRPAGGEVARKPGAGKLGANGKSRPAPPATRRPDSDKRPA